MKILIVGPILLAGIGQVLVKYQKILQERGHETEYCTFFELEKVNLNDWDRFFTFLIPAGKILELTEKLPKDRTMIMTVCETETVHENYSLFPKNHAIFVPSLFSLKRLERQFPEHTFVHLKHWTPWPLSVAQKIQIDADYVFYTIGNIKDPRKNLFMLIEAFQRLQLPRAHLLIKNTGLEELNSSGIHWLTVINHGVITDADMEVIHNSGDCYVNCSHSEGVGMGSVEAALRDKPVIVSEYGGATEYINTPFVIECTKGPIGFDDFLFTAHMEWGHPDIESLMKHMRECYDRKLKSWDHYFTKQILRAVPYVFEHYIVSDPVGQSRYENCTDNHLLLNPSV